MCAVTDGIGVGVRAGCSTCRLTSWLANQRLSSILGLTLRALHHRKLSGNSWILAWCNALRDSRVNREVNSNLHVEQLALSGVVVRVLDS